MSTRTIYKCDRCKVEDADKAFLVGRVSVNIASCEPYDRTRRIPDGMRLASGGSHDWCVECATAAGLIIPTEQRELEDAQSLHDAETWNETLGRRIYDLVHEILDEAMDT